MINYFNCHLSIICILAQAIPCFLAAAVAPRTDENIKQLLFEIGGNLLEN